MNILKQILQTIRIFVMIISLLMGCDVEIKSPIGNLEIEGIDVQADTSWYRDWKKTFTLTKASQLMGLSELAQEKDFKGKTIKLGADIALNPADKMEVEKWKQGTEKPSNRWMPLGTTHLPFAGKIDGQGHTISGLFVVGEDEGTGFIGVAATTVELEDIRFVDGYIMSSSDYTGLIGKGLVKRIENVYSNLVIEGMGFGTGGFVGWYEGGYTNKETGDAEKWKHSCMRINNCWFDGEIISTGVAVGGCVGGQEHRARVDITNFLATGKITSKRWDEYGRAGAIFGWMNYSAKYNLTNCISTVKVESDYTGGGNMVGALIGDLGANGLTITNCYGIGTKVAGRNQKGYSLGDGILKTIDEIKALDVDKALPKLPGEIVSPWRAKKNSAPVLRGLK